jgi:hypothetical protein
LGSAQDIRRRDWDRDQVVDRGQREEVQRANMLSSDNKGVLRRGNPFPFPLRLPSSDGRAVGVERGESVERRMEVI